MPTCIRHNSKTGRFERKVFCESCQMLSINGLPCHETGCRDAWRDETRECFQRGCDFKPEGRWQQDCEGCLNPPTD